VDVIDHFAEVVALPRAGVAERAEVALDEDGFISPAEEMAPEPVAGIDASSDRVLKPSHALDEVGFRRLENPMVVIVHQNPRVGLELCHGAGLSQGFREKLAVRIVEDDGLTAVSACHDVVGGVLVLDPWGSGHEGTVRSGESGANSKF